MTDVTARLRIKGKSFEILVDVDKALQLRKGVPVSIQNILSTDKIFSDLKKGMQASDSDLNSIFNSTDLYVITEKIVRQGEIEVPKEYKEKERSDKVKQVVDFLARNALDPTTNKPHSSERIKSAIESSGVNIDNRPIEEQIAKIIEKLRVILPIKIETKRLIVKIPAIHTGKAYGLVQEYKEKESWLNNGDLECTISLPAGMQMVFYDKLNAITHGSAIVSEVKS